MLASIDLPGPGTVYATLSPSRPVVANRAALAFEHPQVIDGGWDYALWYLWGDASPSTDHHLAVAEGKGVKRLGIWFKSEAAGRRYLVDSAVNPVVGAQVFSVFSGDSVMQESVLPDEGGHVTFVVETQDANWYGFMLMSDLGWRFSSCEITRL